MSRGVTGAEQLGFKPACASDVSCTFWAAVLVLTLEFSELLLGSGLQTSPHFCQSPPPRVVSSPCYAEASQFESIFAFVVYAVRTPNTQERGGNGKADFLAGSVYTVYRC